MPYQYAQFLVEGRWVNTMVAAYIGSVPGLYRLHGTLYQKQLYTRFLTERCPSRLADKCDGETLPDPRLEQLYDRPEWKSPFSR